jgi:predicted kinase
LRVFRAGFLQLRPFVISSRELPPVTRILRSYGHAAGTSACGLNVLDCRALAKYLGYKYRVPSLPTLVVVSGPPGSGKTTLAHQVARAVGCPVICRDEIKEGMVHATPDFVAAPTDDLALRTLPTFFSVLELLLKAGVTTVAEAAFQDRLWRAGLAPLNGLAQLRMLHCTVDAEVAFRRSLERSDHNPLRAAHTDPGPDEAEQFIRQHRAFDRVSVDAPSMEVDTTGEYSPTLVDIVAFINAQR